MRCVHDLWKIGLKIKGLSSQHPGELAGSSSVPFSAGQGKGLHCYHS